MTSVQDPSLWAPLRVGRVSERVAERILGLIAAERLRPGERLPSERALAAALGVGRPSLREALKVLQARGHVEIRHGTGTFVAEPSSARELAAALERTDLSLAELFAMREVLEAPAAEWAAVRGDPGELTAVGEAHEALHAASIAEPLDVAALQSLDGDFHLRIAEAAGNRLLLRTARALHHTLLAGIETTLALPGRLERAREEHLRILEAILAGDGPGAAMAARRHVESARGAALARGGGGGRVAADGGVDGGAADDGAGRGDAAEYGAGRGGDGPDAGAVAGADAVAGGGAVAGDRPPAR